MSPTLMPRGVRSIMQNDVGKRRTAACQNGTHEGSVADPVDQLARPARAFGRPDRCRHLGRERNTDLSGPDGYWTVGSTNYTPMEMATRAMFHKAPQEVWAWYLWRFAACADAEPNAGHHAVVALEKALGNRMALVTQNVDGLHQRAGSPSQGRTPSTAMRASCAARRSATRSRARSRPRFMDRGSQEPCGGSSLARDAEAG